MFFCENCGTKLNDGVAFCVQCGAPVQETKKEQVVHQPQVQPYTYQAASNPPAVKDKVPGRGLGVGSITLGIICFVYAILFAIITLVANNVTEEFVPTREEFYSDSYYREYYGDISYNEFYEYGGYAELDEGVETVLDGLLIPVIAFAALAALGVFFALAAIFRGYKNSVSFIGMVVCVIGLCGYIYTIITLANVV